MDIPKLQLLMHKEKTWLGKIYLGNSMQIKHELSAATNLQLRILISILHHLTTGSIHIGKSQLESISTSTKSKLVSNCLNKVSSKQKTNKVLRSSRKEQLGLLFKLSPAYTQLLYRLFNLPKSMNEDTKPMEIKDDGTSKLDPITSNIVE